MEILRAESFFNGKGKNDAGFSARDRINRAPKSLGFVKLKPTISLTPAGEALVTSRRKDEVFLRQMLKFQIPSPYHIPTKKAATFCVKPYLELLRLVRTVGTLKFDELQLFGMQLTDWRKFDEIVGKIEKFRKDRLETKTGYRTFYAEYTKAELKRIYTQRIARGETKTRESKDKSLEKFLDTQSRNMRDYADACFRYLRATGLVNVSHVGKSLSIMPERQADVDYLLSTVSREPSAFASEAEYADYLGNAATPLLYTDNKDRLLQRMAEEFPNVAVDRCWDVEKLKDVLADNAERRKEEEIAKQVSEIKHYKLYDDIQHVFRQIADKKLYDAPLMLEWNTWRAMTMLDGGDIKANLNFDDFGQPLSTAPGNVADIECDYGDFKVTVEVTMASGQKQYEMESEPVSRHLGKMKTGTGKPCYCLFVAPTIKQCLCGTFLRPSPYQHKLLRRQIGDRPVAFGRFPKDARRQLQGKLHPRPCPCKAFLRTVRTDSRQRMQRNGMVRENETDGGQLALRRPKTVMRLAHWCAAHRRCSGAGRKMPYGGAVHTEPRRRWR